VPKLAADARCIAPDFPLGSHTPAMPEADLTLPGQAQIVVDLLDALDLPSAVIVGTGYGGDIAQMVAAEHPRRVTALVLIATNAFDSDPWPTKLLAWLGRPPGAAAVLARAVRIRQLMRTPITYGWATKYPISDDIMAAYTDPVRTDPAVRRDLLRFLRGLSPKYLADASPRLASFTKPALVVWPTEDRVFPAEGARRLVDTMPRAELVEVGDSYSWVAEDQPDELVIALAGFLTSKVA
jgi:pimeloyl-ACP methyl ester carboxylesterase